MKEIAKINASRFYETAEKEAEVKAAIAAIDDVDSTLNVLEEKVAPYGYYIAMREIVDSAREWSNYTAASRQVIIAELNGCIDVVNAKIRLYNEDDKEVIFLAGEKFGNIKVLKESLATALVELGIAKMA